MSSMAKMIGKFDGSGDVVVWLKKVKLVGELQKMGDLSLIITLILEGGAFALYEQLSKNEKASAVDIEKALLDAFAVDLFEAYELLRDRRWNEAESVDIYMASLRQLMQLAKVENEELLQRAFITGLPGEISKQLQSQVKIFGINLNDVLNHTRVLLSKVTKEECLLTTISGSHKNNNKKSASRFNCYNCGKPGHVARSCFAKKETVTEGIQCFRCGKTRHIARFCSLKQGNASGKPTAPAVSLDN
ncbi:uncharacterized protein LOC105843650 [Hydra vulgaris]|uniref:uncharacterized protein LOC105843650 n=1 Tax=Hydra vulgaris TaxID=6087 RepID=UPI000640C8F4|nr:uncharacterized protein LOC105843650 [Hydra vulgaris]